MKERMKKLKELVTKSKKNLVITIGCTLLVICMVGGGIIYATQPADCLLYTSQLHEILLRYLCHICHVNSQRADL